ncbi:MAG: 30S ribosomal protein S12 methylthiotransferase RimO [Planctomycetes bacterium]|nr:30S ribosomal protein S12 methylthiotransferase RimO [Planctomycetota bacterium]
MSDPTLVTLVHLGCARNLIDSELILGRMAEEGLVVTGDPDAAGTVVINTCSFIGPAQQESEQTVRDWLARKRSGALRHVVVAGCLVQRYRKALRERFPDVDLFAEISDYRDLARSIRGLAEGKRVPSYLEGPAQREPEREGARLLATPGSYAFLRISHGCDHQCSFCTIPSIRGTHRSKPVEALVSEAEELVGAGAKELVLVAEDSTWWGRDLGLRLPHLVERLADVEGLHWLRLMYAYPNDFPWELTTLLREHPRVATYLDMPVQHAATDVLRAMRRAGSGDQVRRLLDRLFAEVPDLSLRTTLLLGFPGETEAHVDEVVDLLETYRLGRVGAFVYSPEPGTPSYDLPGRVPAEVAAERHARVLAARDRVLRAEQEALIGREVELLVDEPAGPDGACVAHGERDAPESDLVTWLHDAAADWCQASPGEVVRARVTGVDDDHNPQATLLREEARP